MRTQLATTALALVLAAPGLALAQQDQPQQGGADIQVQQPAPQINVQQPEPTVTVQQPAPQVTIEQPKPQVTIEQPKPEVTVQQAEPNVEVQQQGQPNVQVQQQGQPEVTVQQPGSEQAQGGGQQPAAEGAVATGGGTQGWYASRRGEEIVGQTLYGSGGEEIGEVNDVVLRQGGSTPEALVGVGGFLGLGEREVAIPLDQIQMGGDDRLTTTMDRDAIGQMEPYDESSYQPFDRGRPLGGGM